MKLISGPMATISHPAFRILIEKFGACDEYFTEMINAGTLLTGGQFEKYYIDPAPVPEKVVWQLTGHDAEHLEEAARVLCDLPGLGVDINMGCSAPDIYRYGAGIAWMLKAREETEEMVKRVGKVVIGKKRFSVKLRLGDDNFTDEQFFSFCDMLLSNGVELLTLHPRTKKEKLTRPARYSYCQKLCERYPKIPVYLNGNVKDAVSLKNALASAPDVKGVMISRACVQKPWIFREMSSVLERGLSLEGEPAVEEKLSINMKDLALSYIDDVEKYQPPEFWKTRLQRFFTYFCQNFKFAHYAQTQFLNARDNADLRVRIEDFFTRCPDEVVRFI